MNETPSGFTEKEWEQYKKYYSQSMLMALWFQKLKYEQLMKAARLNSLLEEDNDNA